MRTLQATVLVVLALGIAIGAHDLEGTRVVLSFSSDGSFVLDIAHEPNWLLMRLESFAGGQVPPGITPAARDARLRELGNVLIDRVVLWVDGREIRPESAEYLASDATFRLRGRMPLEAKSLRWLYGPVVDSYPLIVRRADGRTLAESIDGSNWSGMVDLTGQFTSTRWGSVNHVVLLVGFFALMLGWRVRLATCTTESHDSRRQPHTARPRHRAG
jgi:hypothetical protein